MKTYLTLVLAVALTGCGLFSSTPAARTTAPAEVDQEPATPSVYAWQTELGPTEQSKITHKLWLWLDGDAPDGLEVQADAPEPLIHVTAKTTHELGADELAYFDTFGLTATEGSAAATGFVTRTQLLELAREGNVERIDPASAAQVEREERRARRDRRRARASARRNSRL